MEEIFELIIAVIGIGIAVAKTMSKGKKVKKNAPGQAKAPAYEEEWPAESAVQSTVKPISPGQPVQPTVAPMAKAEAPASASIPVQPTFWQQLGEALKEELGVGEPQKGHGTVKEMPEGDSRECEHGSIGGSMAYERHQGGRVIKDRPAAAAKPAAKEEAFRPAMNAEEMRRAVVMAEILKRPQERMAEQARRWSVR